MLRLICWHQILSKEIKQSLIQLLIVLEQCEDGVTIKVSNNALEIDLANGFVILFAVIDILKLQNVQV